MCERKLRPPKSHNREVAGVTGAFVNLIAYALGGERYGAVDGWKGDGAGGHANTFFERIAVRLASPPNSPFSSQIAALIFSGEIPSPSSDW
jgi:hypothetical protein